MAPLPGWLTHRAKVGGFARIIEILPPAGPRAQAIYLLAAPDEHLYELHVVEDASSGIDGVTIPLTAKEAIQVGFTWVGAMARGIPGITVEELAKVQQLTDEPEETLCGDSGPMFMCERLKNHDGKHAGHGQEWGRAEAAEPAQQVAE